MNGDVNSKIKALEEQVRQLTEWKQRREEMQLMLPVDLTSIRALDEALSNNSLQNIIINNVGIYVGSGAPARRAAKGSLYLRTDGSSSSTRAYINTDSGTTWVNITTAS